MADGFVNGAQRKPDFCELQAEVYSIGKESATNTSEIANINNRLDRQFTLIESAIVRLEKKVDTLSEYVNKSRGGITIAAWVVGVSLTLTTITISLINILG